MSYLRCFFLGLVLCPDVWGEAGQRSNRGGAGVHPVYRAGSDRAPSVSTLPRHRRGKQWKSDIRYENRNAVSSLLAVFVVCIFIWRHKLKCVCYNAPIANSFYKVPILYTGINAMLQNNKLVSCDYFCYTKVLRRSMIITIRKNNKKL